MERVGKELVGKEFKKENRCYQTMFAVSLGQIMVER
jgi:hypothetical protein